MAKFNDTYKPECEMVGQDGNAFAIIGRVSKCLKAEGMADRAKEWQEKAMSQKSYDDLLALMYDYVDPQ